MHCAILLHEVHSTEALRWHGAPLRIVPVGQPRASSGGMQLKTAGAGAMSGVGGAPPQ